MPIGTAAKRVQPFPNGVPESATPMSVANFMPPAAPPPPTAADLPQGQYQPTTGPLPLANPRQSLGDRLNTWFTDPHTSAMLMRASAGAFDGGLGGALRAATGYSDQQHAIETASAQQAIENLFKQQQLDETGQYHRGELGIEGAKVVEQGAANRATAAGIARGQDMNYGLGKDRLKYDYYNANTTDSRERDADFNRNFVTMRGQNMSAETSRGNAKLGAQSREQVADARAAAQWERAVLAAGSKDPSKVMLKIPIMPQNPNDRDDGGVYRSPTGAVGQWDAETERWAPIKDAVPQRSNVLNQ